MSELGIATATSDKIVLVVISHLNEGNIEDAVALFADQFSFKDHGMFRFIRHPNYLGEMTIYGSFALMVWHWLSVVVLAWVWGGLFAVNMTLKEASMSRYAEWTHYKSHSWWLL